MLGCLLAGMDLFTLASVAAQRFGYTDAAKSGLGKRMSTMLLWRLGKVPVRASHHFPISPHVCHLVNKSTEVCRFIVSVSYPVKSNRG